MIRFVVVGAAVLAVLACLVCPLLLVVAVAAGAVRGNRRVVGEAREVMAVIADGRLWRDAVTTGRIVVATLRGILERVIGVVATSPAAAATPTEPVVRPTAMISRRGGARAPRRARCRSSGAASRETEGGCAGSLLCGVSAEVAA